MTEPTQPQGVTPPAGDPNAQNIPAAPQAQFAAPAQGAPVANPEEAGKGLSIAGIILGIFIPIVGLILGIVGMNQNKQAGGDGKLGKIAVIVSVVFIVLYLILSFVIPALMVATIDPYSY